MKILLDENAPSLMVDVLRHLLPGHRVDHVTLMKWSGKKDLALLADAASHGYDIFVTKDARQLDDPDETTAIKKSRLHHVRFGQPQPGRVGLALAIGAVIGSLPMVVRDLENAEGQRLVMIKGLAPGTKHRFDMTDPAKEPPRYWPR
ncbi:DUF5615 family PIN-like protein [Streptomyces aidingensis]|uniref:VapC45 PIN like domain-containing protein n=1 Tax=Streptomyces aidingensis TaxID=910347 RepID=A0A1I1Q1F4_9ACTN|nr:DUF5615 family PIN-like protein [Streptomyces aidingensis]SFD15966.1 hypothetical protein SAMN05421773_110216 [Streptomyces aidingensis]